MKQLTIVLLACCPLLAQAADLPVLVNENRALNMQMCIDRAKDDCINTICVHSSNINCSQNCLQSAKDQCKIKAAE